MSAKFNSEIAVIGIDIGKNSFHIVGLDRRGAIVLRQKWSRGQVEAPHRGAKLDQSAGRNTPSQKLWKIHVIDYCDFSRRRARIACAPRTPLIENMSRRTETTSPFPGPENNFITTSTTTQRSPIQA